MKNTNINYLRDKKCNVLPFRVPNGGKHRQWNINIIQFIEQRVEA